MSYFLLVYDRRAGRLLEAKSFSSKRSADALRERFALESEGKQEDNIEIVVLGAESLSALKRTHARYFSEDPLDLVRP